MMRPWGIRPTVRPVAAALTLATIGMWVVPRIAASAPPLCEMASFTMAPQPADVSDRPNAIVAEWQAIGNTTASCPGNAVVALDVWEHAIVTFPNEGGRLRGRADGYVVANGQLVGWAAQVQGTADCHDGDAGPACRLDVTMRGRFDNGSRLLLRQRWLLDVVNGFLMPIEDVFGFYEPWPMG